MSGFDVFFAGIEDPRAANVSHGLSGMSGMSGIFVLMVAAGLCGASNASEFARFAESRKRLLGKLTDYDCAPGHETFSRVLRLLDPRVFMQAFAVFAGAFAKALAQSPAKSGKRLSAKLVAIDGKALRQACERGRQARPPLAVSAFALHCHHRMAEAITARRGDHVLALKGNRHEWLAEAGQCFAVRGKPRIIQATETHHGRNEWRMAEVIASKPLMKGHCAFIRITTQRDASPPFVRHCMASKNLAAKAALDVTRAHWGIENGLHGIFGVHPGENLSRARKHHAPANIALASLKGPAGLETGRQ